MDIYILSIGTMSQLVSPSVELCGAYEWSYWCQIGDELAVDYGNGRYDYTNTLTWNGENITSGVVSQSINNGDHVYRFHLRFGGVERNHYLTITGKVIL